MNEYNQAFYDDQEQESLASARVLLGLLFTDYRPSSVIDVGCGLGTWLSVCAEQGASDLIGIDGAHVDRQRLHIPTECYVAHDLSSPLDVARSFELAMSLEVAEHLPAHHADAFVTQLTGLSDVVLFSAALPYQGGTGHVNENWAEYWSDKFRQRGFALVDRFRAAVWNDPRVAFWYRQNCFLYVRETRLAALGFTAWHEGDMPLSAIHPEMFLWACARERVIGGGPFERDRAYWRNAVQALHDGRAVAEPASAYGRQYQVRFGAAAALRRLRGLLK